MNPEQLRKINADAESTLGELMEILNHTPGLATEVKPLIQSEKILSVFQTLSADKPDIAEQLLRLALATTVNYNTLTETTKQLANAGQ